MVTRQANDVLPPPQTSVAPVVKRKRRASCLGEQERRERKRAIDREAQRSLREKTKTHIAELERTIQILRDQDRNGATANLLSEIDVLRAENERLRDIIDSVKNVVGCDLFSRNAAPSSNANGGNGPNSPVGSSIGQRSPKPRTISFNDDTKPHLPTPIDQQNPFDRPPAAKRPLDLDGMTVMTDADVPAALIPGSGVILELEPVAESPEEEQTEELPWEKNPETASWGPMMEEIFGPNWRCPSPVVLHIGNPDVVPPPSSAICPLWKRSNELFGKVFSYRSGKHGSTTCHYSALESASSAQEAGLLYLGIKRGWEHVSNSWMQSPALTILKQVDELLWAPHLPKMDRLATAYKNYKLLKYYLNADKEALTSLPSWLRPSPTQSSTPHPIAVDFFAWPTLRSRLVQSHKSIFQTNDLSSNYSRYLRFDWPFSFQDAFFLNDESGEYVPSPLFEHYHSNLKYWTVDERFYDRFPEMRADIEGDRWRFCEEECG